MIENPFYAHEFHGDYDPVGIGRLDWPTTPGGWGSWPRRARVPRTLSSAGGAHRDRGGPCAGKISPEREEERMRDMDDDAHPADGPEPEAVMGALKEAICRDPSLRRMPPERLADELVRGGHLWVRPDPSVVAFLLNLLGSPPRRGQAGEGGETSPTIAGRLGHKPWALPNSG